MGSNIMFKSVTYMSKYSLVEIVGSGLGVEEYVSFVVLILVFDNFICIEISINVGIKISV